MITLGVDSSSLAASVAIVVDDKLILEYMLQNELTHSQTLMPMIAQAFKAVGLTPNDVDRFACSCGPGSFTGLRIGIATVKGLAYAVNKPAVGISTLRALAFNIPCSPYLICPIMDARRNQVYTALYRQGSELTEVSPPKAVGIEELVKEISEPVIFVGDGAIVNYEYLKQNCDAHFAPKNLNYTRASSVALACDKTVDGLHPVYLRKPQAEREYNERMNINDSIR